MFTLAPFSPSLLSLPKSRHYPPPNPNFLLHHQTLALINPIKPTAAASSAAVIAAVDSASDGEDEVWEEEEEEVEDEFLAFEEMRKWERNKPTGFGQGKVYDTTVEEKLLEEIEIEMKRSSHEAQVVAKSDAKKEEPQIKGLKRNTIFMVSLLSVKGLSSHSGSIQESRKIGFIVNELRSLVHYKVGSV